ncbi:regulatory protein RecX [Polynucleobacter necessarius]|uniref:regulatory protein RecX n=1 Tax=Polynucleobacter necessarius TaxID=576610 RepID=UPI001E6168A4|nr:regulatory protein RecX [Polynucleobacter necessarius]
MGDEPLTSDQQATVSSIEAVLDDFEARGWLSDERFAEALVRRRSERFGLRKIADELARADIDSRQSIKLLNELKVAEFQRAYDLWLRKYGQKPQDQKKRARHYRFLVSKDFSPDVVPKVIGGQTPD